jgi:UDP-N-acetylmuramoylalanine--D-glutamate ligase
MEVPWSHEPWRRVLVYGFGVSGRSAVALLRSRGVAVVIADRRTLPELEGDPLLQDPAVSLLAGGEDGALPEALDGVVVSPGVPADRPLLVAARRRGLPAIAEVELAFHLLDGLVVGITGSNGKSTTTAMTGAILRAAGFAVEVCGNIGRPLSACVEGPPGRIFVVELSSFQLEGIRTFRPRAAALLNISADHLDRHGDVRGYRAAKLAIFQSQMAEDVAVLNGSDPRVHTAETRSRRRFFSLESTVSDGCYLDGESVVEAIPGKAKKTLFQPSDLTVAGRHNLENGMAAALLACAAGAPASAVATGLRTFRGLPHRMELVQERDGVAWYDDSKGTNLGATRSCLQGFADGSVNLILGGRSKGADFALLRPIVGQKARRVYLIGESAAELEQTLLPVTTEHGLRLSRVDTLDRAVVQAATEARSGEVVLLSPACSSFDQFTSFAERGRVFQGLVQALGGVADG